MGPGSESAKEHDAKRTPVREEMGADRESEMFGSGKSKTESEQFMLDGQKQALPERWWKATVMNQR